MVPMIVYPPPLPQQNPVGVVSASGGWVGGWVGGGWRAEAGGWVEAGGRVGGWVGGWDLC